VSARSQAKYDQLLERFVASFEKLDEMILDEAFEFESWSLKKVPAGKTGCERWAPIKYATDARNLEALYARIPARFPPLYERLVLSYRWENVDIRCCTLLANPPGADLSGLFVKISYDATLWTQLTRGGYVPFAWGPAGSYDRVCFDLKSRKKSGDCNIVLVNHEEILCNNRIRTISEIATSFEDLVLQTIDVAEKA
jgi:hypothetical protein